MIFYGFIVLVLGSCVARIRKVFCFAYSIIKNKNAYKLSGTFRYFRVQQTLPRGFFPTSMHSIAGLAFFLGAFITVAFGILVAGKT